MSKHVHPALHAPQRDDERPRRRVARVEETSTDTTTTWSPSARAHPMASTPGAASLLRQQQTHGNRYVARLVQERRQDMSAPAALSLTEIGQRARAAAVEPGIRVAFAGSPLKMEPPDGMNDIASKSGPIGLGGKPAGYTAVKSAAAFTAPNFVTKLSVEKDGYKRHYFVEVQPTSATDAVHASYYPAPGVHDNAVSIQKDGTYHYYWKISAKMSELIRKGEQEHLNDAQRAYDLTYGLIAKEINAMVGQRFGPAETPAAAEKLAEAELARRLPAALGIDQLRWFNVLEAMLDMTLKRDRQHLHDVVPGKPVVRGKTYYIPLEPTDQTRIDEVGSEEIVTYPAATTGTPAPAQHRE